MMVEGRYLKSAFAPVFRILEEMPLELGEDGVRGVGMDSAHVAAARLELPPGFFEEFRPPEEEVEIGVDGEYLARICNRIRVTDEVELSSDGEELVLVVRREGYERVFRVRGIEVGESADLPELEYEAEVTLVPDFLADAVRDVEGVSDTVELVAREGELMLRAEGEHSEVRPVVREGSEALITSVEVEDGEVKALYSVDYLKDMVRAAQGAESVTLRFGEELPLELEFRVGPAGEGTVKFYLAPRVEE